MTPTQRILTVAGLAGSVIAGGVIGATLAGPLAATASSNTPNTIQLTAASASPSAGAGTFKSNENATHESGESATVEAQATHEQAESAAREAQENAGQRPTVP